jgi:ribonuclease E
MTKSIIIDAAYKDETRIAVIENNILQDFDRESRAVKKIKGNIYAATITRIEPSLQAAFVDYGDEKSGFLPFSDIHPSYYNLSEEEKKQIIDHRSSNRNHNDNDDHNNGKDSSEHIITTGSFTVDEETDFDELSREISSGDEKFNKKYKIEDVMEIGTKILVQVLKEERGNKGVAMTSYISIAGRYCVLMTNISGKGGISKKVNNIRDRKSLRIILNNMNIDDDKSIIIRTAGIGKTSDEIENDYKYLSKLWNHIINECQKTRNPLLIHSEDDIAKKIVCNIDPEEIKEIIIEGKRTYNQISNLIKIAGASDAKVKLYNDRIPIFNKYKIENQIDQLYERYAHLPSGGSIVIDQTEALIAIDINSGKATNHKNVEETAYKTNLEAVDEISRQVRLRDLSGLIVIDFIDMEDASNRRLIEKSLRDSLKNDRARVQIGKISIFGLLELSRQRSSNSFFETITKTCHKCGGSGYIKSEEVLALNILRSIRYATNDKQTGVIYVKAPNNVISYMMNYKRKELYKIEKSYNIHIIMHSDDDMNENSFQIRKRKNLLDQEKKLLLLDSEKIGKVNQMDIAKKYYGNLDHKSKNRSRKKYNNSNKKPTKRKSLFAKIFGK